jgi:hypothetical protein
MLKISDFQILKNHKMSCRNDRNVLFFAANSKNTANLCICSHSAQMSTSSLNNSDNLPVQKVPSRH